MAIISLTVHVIENVDFQGLWLSVSDQLVVSDK